MPLRKTTRNSEALLQLNQPQIQQTGGVVDSAVKTSIQTPSLLRDNP